MILCERGPEGGPALFRDPRAVVTAWTAAEVAPALARLDAARAGGRWVAGHVAYEAGLALEPRLAPLVPGPGEEPLLAFGIFDAPADPAPLLARAGADAAGASLRPLVPLVPRADYGAAFRRVQRYIAAGDCYQINLTLPLETRLAGTPLGLFGALRAAQPVGWGAFSDLGAGPVVVSRSPEQFFTVQGGTIASRPMKGTAPRGQDPAEDAALARALSLSEKARAENLMIVDLLRNDIARLAEVGSVRVPELFRVERFATVHQMSSLVTGRLAAAPGLAGLMRALFPCGSITGAPKIRAMAIIAEVEPHPRGVYCGAVGWMAPGGDAAFSVAIRTLRVWPDGRVLLNAGGGVVADSTEDGEWEEALWKTRFVRALTTPA